MDFKERYQYNPRTGLLGKGGFAKVFKAHDVFLDRDVALKFFNSDSPDKYGIISEIRHVIKFDHPNLVRYFDAELLEMTDVHGESTFLQVGVMELMNRGDLKNYASGNPNPQQLKKLLIDVLEGLGYLHKKGIIHRDMKPQNILLNYEDGELIAKIADFGISKSTENSNSASSALLGTIEYMAPEQFNPQKYGVNGKIGTNVDLWSFGVMVYELVMGESLFGSRGEETSTEQLIHQILYVEGEDKKINNLPQPYYNVVKACLAREAMQRVPNAATLIEIMNGNNVNFAATENIANETRVYDPKNLSNNGNKQTEVMKLGIAGQNNSMDNEKIAAQKSRLPVIIAIITLLLVIGVAVYLLIQPEEVQNSVATNSNSSTVNSDKAKSDNTKQANSIAAPTKNTSTETNTVKPENVPLVSPTYNKPITGDNQNSNTPPKKHIQPTQKQDIPAKLTPEEASTDLMIEMNKEMDEIDPGVIKKYIDEGADVKNAKNNKGQNLLMIAAIKNDVPLAKLLISKNMNVNAKANNGLTALMYASAFGAVKTAILLLDNKADVNAKDEEGKTALDIDQDDENMNKILLEHHAKHGWD